MKYRAKIKVPEEFTTFLEAVRSVAAIENLTDYDLTIEFEADDEWQLHEQVIDLRDQIDALYIRHVDIPRPVPLEDTTVKYDVFMERIAEGKKVHSIKAVRSLNHMGLMDAKNFCDDVIANGPKVLLQNVKLDVAINARTILEAGGAICRIVP